MDSSDFPHFQNPLLYFLNQWTIYIFTQMLAKINIISKVYDITLLNCPFLTFLQKLIFIPTNLIDDLKIAITSEI